MATVMAKAFETKGAAMGSADFKDLTETPGIVTKTAGMVAANTVHLATLLKEKPFPG